MKPVAIVTPWFGSELKGGAEQQAWQLATRLSDRGYAIDVLTTCSRAFLDDWAVNYYQPGLHETEKCRVLRFRVDKRQRQQFDHANGLMLSLPVTTLKYGVNPVTAEAANIFSAENINSTDLLNYLKTHEDDYHAFIFLPYLYGLILNGLPLVAQKAFLQPCLHNEVYAYLPAVANIFHKTKGLLFISAGEAQLAQQLYGPGIIFKSTVVGAGVETNQSDNRAVCEIDHFQVTQERFVLYLGRRDATKNTNLVVEAYQLFKQNSPDSNLKLVLAGPGNTSYDSVDGVIDLGLVAEAEKSALLAHCVALFQPSRNESYSRVIMEAWFYEKPVAAHRDCLATALAVKSAQGGWLAATPSEWQELFAQIDTLEPAQLAEYGANGKKYAQDHASWDQIIQRYETVLGLSTAETHPTIPPRRKLTAIHQLLPNLNYGDAISNHALFIRNYLRDRGYHAEIFVRYLDPLVEHEAKAFQPDAIAPQSGLIYHHSIGSELTPYAIAHAGPKCLIYHNITPAEFFQPYRPDFAKILETGRAELGQLATYFTFSVGDSAYNAAELAASGFAAPGVLPIAVAPDKWDIPADESLMAQLQDGKTNILFVGRLAPNKCQHDLIKAFAQYITIDAPARLILAGSGASTDPYYNHLINTIQELNLTEHVLITGQVNDAQLLALYRTADLFWSMSEHEGFCVPLIEAMWFDIPVLAYKSSVIPETLSTAGIMFTHKDELLQVAALAKILVQDQTLREKVLDAQRQRRASFLPLAVHEHLDQLTENLESDAIDASSTLVEESMTKNTSAPDNTNFFNLPRKSFPTAVKSKIKSLIHTIENQPNDLFPLVPALPLPEGISESHLRNFLRNVRVADAPPQEMLNYCEQDFRRFVYTYGLARDLQGKCLELGSNPYFTTMLLRQFTSLQLTLANYFGSHIQDEVTQEVAYKTLESDEDALVKFDSYHFNIEADKFPFSDAEFDVILFCEIIEHLLVDPAAVLREIKRILKSNGVLILTTPNISRLENVTKMIAGENIYDPYSSYGPYGRHNREYNKHELYLLLDYLGFTIDSMFTADVHHNNANSYASVHNLAPLLNKRKFDLGQYIFVRASNSKEARSKKPSFLYRSYPSNEIE